MDITVLVENSGLDGLGVKAEFGLSLLIERNDYTVLLDTGQTDQFAKNADALGKDLQKVDALVISHGHFDHGGGLEAFLKRNSHAKVYIKHEAFRPAFGTVAPGLPAFLHRTGVVTRDIGLNPELQHKYAERIEWVENDVELIKGVNILTEIPEKHPKPNGNKFLLTRQNGSYVPDDFCHELVLSISENNRRVLFSGCAHNGILNMIDTVKNYDSDTELVSVVGGFHLNLPRSEKMSAPAEEIQTLARELDSIVTGPIYTGHCTGLCAFDEMKKILGEKLHAMPTGLQFSV